MKPWLPLGLFLLIIFIFGSPASAQIYQWKEKDGNVRFSDTPPPIGVKAEKQRVRESTESPAASKTQESPTGKSEASNSPAKKIRPYGDITVLMYMTDWCPYCRKARETLNSLGVNLIEYNIDKDKEKREEMKQKGGTGGVPFIEIEGITIRGYSAEAIKAAVEKRRGL